MTARPVAYLGPPGTFSEAAARAVTDSPTGAPTADAPTAGAPAPGAPTPDALRPYPSVADAIDAVRDGSAAAAVVPLENSVEGSVATTLDELAAGTAPLRITREVVLPVSFSLLARPGTTLADVRTVTTIPHAEAQVRGWLRRTLPGHSFVPAASTADGARAVAAGAADAAISAPLAAERYRLDVLAADLHDVADAVTRFVVVTGQPALPPPTGADRTTLVAFIAEDHPGALLEILTEFAVRGVNLTRIESRPTGSGLGRYYFSIDAEGHVADARVGEALSALHRVCANVRFLGSYPRVDGVAPRLRPGVGDDSFAAAARWLAGIRGLPSQP